MRQTPLPGQDELPCGAMCLWTLGDLQSLKPCGTMDWYGGSGGFKGSPTYLLTPALVEAANVPGTTKWPPGTWLRCMAAVADDLQPGRRCGISFRTKVEALEWIRSRI